MAAPLLAYTPTLIGNRNPTIADQPPGWDSVTKLGTAGPQPVQVGSHSDASSDSITAFAGGGQTSATQLTTQINRVTTVATAADSVKLPPSVAGMSVVVVNSAAKAMQVFGYSTSTINDIATATGISQAPNSIALYFCPVAGKWYQNAASFSGGLGTFTSANALTAHAGGTQAAALQLSALVNRITTAATAGDSVKLPVSAPGLEVAIINNGANAIQVYGAGTDTINGVATATGVSQLPNSVVFYACTVAGLWQAQDVGRGYSGNLPTLSSTNAITAHAGGGQASAVALATVINRVTTVGSAADSVVLPAAKAGMMLIVTNAAAANSMNVFPASGETINALAADTALAIVANKSAVFSCAVDGAWNSILTA